MLLCGSQQRTLEEGLLLLTRWKYTVCVRYRTSAPLLHPAPGPTPRPPPNPQEVKG